MARLPNLGASDIIKALERAGFVFERQKGSHVTLRHPKTEHTTVVPVHTNEFPRSLLKLILKQAGLSESSASPLALV
ncbi:MAG: type II toxin-antitoxin system HicA family toxin [Methyloceanibacter sp.]|jgi:predicted RNA binding protein YcfA (HicA-like mRNA interferase family)